MGKGRMEQGMDVVNVNDLEPQYFSAHGGSGEIQMRFAFPEHSEARGAGWSFFGVALFPKGSSAGLHKHQGNDEWFYILSGSATLVVDGEPCRISSGDIVLTKDGSSHEIMDVSEPLTLIAIEVRTTR